MTSYPRRCDVITSHRRGYDVILSLNAKMTSYPRRCNVITSHRRGYDVILSPNAKMTSYPRRCNVITSHRRGYDVILSPNAHWVETRGIVSNVLNLALRDRDTDTENVTLIRLSVSDDQKTCSSKGVSLVGI